MHSVAFVWSMFFVRSLSLSLSPTGLCVCVCVFVWNTPQKTRKREKTPVPSSNNNNRLAYTFHPPRAEPTVARLPNNKISMWDSQSPDLIKNKLRQEKSSLRCSTVPVLLLPMLLLLLLLRQWVSLFSALVERGCYPRIICDGTHPLLQQHSSTLFYCECQSKENAWKNNPNW